MMPAGWSGDWVVNNERALDGSYSLRSRYEQSSDITFSVLLANPGQISFFYSFANCGSISLYIDDNLIQTYAFNSGEWLQALNNIDAGSHIIKWHLTADYCGYAGRYIYGTGYIDNIVLPK